MTALLDSDAPNQPWALTAARLRERDHDPAYADAPVLDVYARISFNPTTGDMEKTDRQIADCLGNIEKRGARLGAILRDDNRSAWKRNAKRDGLRELLARIEAGHSHGVVVWHVDRLLRQPRDLERLVDLAEKGLLVASCFGDHSLDDDGDRFVLRVLTAAAEKESANTSRRQTRKMAAMREKGKVGSGPRAFGFPGSARISAEERARLKKAGQPVPQVPAERVEAEREAIAWGTQALLDRVTLAAIAAEWTARGLTTTTGEEEYDASGVRRILAQGRNAGLIERNGVTVGRVKDEQGNTVESIVTEEQLSRVRALLAARRRGRPITGENLSSGILRCDKCGTTLTSQPEAGKTYDDGTSRRRYMCRRKGCGAVVVDQRLADERVRKLTVARLADPRHAAQVASRSKAVAELDTQIGDAEATGREVGARLGGGEISLDRHDAIMEPLDRRLAELRARRDALVALGTGEESVPTPADHAAVERRWNAAEGAERRALIRQAFPLGLSVAPTSARGGGRFDAERIQPVRRRDPARG